MRFGSIALAVALVMAGRVCAQTEWQEFTDRAQHFTVNFPGDPKTESITYKTEKGTSLPAKVYVAHDARGGEYRMTVVNYTSAPDEAPTAIAEAAKTIRAKGEVKYDAQEHSNNMRSQRISV